MAQRARKLEDCGPEVPSLTTFSDVTFQLLIFFMLTIKFKQQEGNLISMLPKNPGPSPVSLPENELSEVRLSICADSITRRFDQHLGVKESHQENIAALKQANPGVGEVCTAWLELNYSRESYPLYRSEKYPSKIGENRRIYALLAEKAKTIRTQLKPSISGGQVRIIIDCDGLVPWEHAFGLLNALQRIGVNDVEWGMNHRFDRYYGPADGK
jgi:biopolymer transport protein ExbD